MLHEIRMVLADGNQDFCRRIRIQVAAEEDLTLTAIVHDGWSALDEVQQKRLHVLLLGQKTHLLGGLRVLDRLQQVPRQVRPRVLFMMDRDDALLPQAESLGADYCILQPFDLPTLMERVRQLARPGGMGQSFRSDMRQRRIYREVVRELAALGVPTQYRGYAFLRRAITYVATNPALLNPITKALYPRVAADSGSRPDVVERAMRGTIEATWRMGDFGHIDQIFGNIVEPDRGKPTNSCFIARMADRVRLGLRLT